MILEMLVTSTALIIGVFCLRKLTLGKISMRLRYGLWLFVAVRLLVPLSVGTSPFSVMNLLPVTFQENTRIFSGERENGGGMSVSDGQDSAFAGEKDDGKFDEWNTEDGWLKGNFGAAAVAESAAQENDSPAADAVREKDGPAVEGGRAGSAQGEFSLPGILGALWLLGFLAVGGYMVISEWRFVLFLRKNREAFSGAAVPEELAGRLLRRGIRVYQVRGLPGPCLVGKHIYIGESVDLQEQELVHVFAHEYCHALHGDGCWAFLRCALAAVYWFDPFVWAAAYAARQDSELACDEAAVKLLGESSRFSYGRTLLALLERAGGRERCPGMSFMTEGGERNVRERILALTERRRMKRSVLAASLVAAVLICGCAFTGAERDDVDSAGKTDGQEVEESGGGTGDGAEMQGTESAAAQNRQMVSEEKNEEFARMQKEYGEVVKTAELLEEQIRELEERAQQEADRAAFEQALNYHGVMEGRDDSELALNREVDYQTYYEFIMGEAENPMENGWYRICENEDAGITLYGLYTEEFGFRGLKTLIGEDVNTYDIQWCSALVNSDKDNILVLERADDGLPRRFVWKLPAVDSSTEEIWRLYSGYRYDTGTVDVKMLSEKECLSWAEEHLTFDVDQEAAKVYVIWDGDVVLGAIDISDYTEWMTEYVQFVPDTFGVALDDRAGEGTAAAGEGGLAVHLIAGLKFEGVEGLWFDGLPLLTVQVVEDENSDFGFRLEYPRIEDAYVAQAPWQEKKLSKLRDE